MPRREEIKIRERTNLYDLLDDGIENGSDLAELSELRANRPDIPHPPNRAKYSVERAIPLLRARRSGFGVFMGIALAIAGACAAAWPEEMMVWHHRIRNLPTVIEHVSASTGRWYGIIVAVTGIVVLAASLVRMHVQQPRA